MSSQTEYKVEDFQEGLSRHDVLVAVCMEAKKPIKKRPVTRKLHETKKKRSVLFLIDEKDLPIKKRKRHEAVEALKRRRVSCNTNVVEPKPALSEAFCKKIEELREGTSQSDDPVLVMQKTLYHTDTDSKQNRLSIPVNQMCCEFLTKEEKEFIEGRTEDNHKNAIEVPIIEPTLGVGMVSLRKWNYEKKNMSYVLNGTWNKIVTNNGLEIGTTVQVWAFRVEEKLCLALVKLS